MITCFSLSVPAMGFWWAQRCSNSQKLRMWLERTAASGMKPAPHDGGLAIVSAQHLNGQAKCWKGITDHTETLGLSGLIGLCSIVRLHHIQNMSIKALDNLILTRSARAPDRARGARSAKKFNLIHQRGFSQESINRGDTSFFGSE